MEYGRSTLFSTTSVPDLPGRLALTALSPPRSSIPSMKRVEARDECSGRSGTLAVENGVKPPYST